MKQVEATLKLDGVKVEICSLEFDVDNSVTDEQIDILIHEKLSERLIVDTRIKETDEVKR